MRNKQIKIGKISVPLAAVVAAIVLVVLVVGMILLLTIPSDSTQDITDSTPTPTPNADNTQDITGDLTTDDSTPEPQGTTAPWEGTGTGLFEDYKQTESDYLAGLEASTGLVFADKTITGPMVYRNDSIRKMFTINGECGVNGFFNLVECDDFTKILSVNYTEEYFNGGYCYGMSFDDPYEMLTPGDYTINDNWFEHVIIQAVPDTTTKLVIFRCRVPMVFVTVARNAEAQTVISAYERPDPAKQVVFIDPYYGGVNDLGGWRSNISICELNLNISLRTNSLLSNEDCQVYLSRDKDEYVGIWERVYLAEAVEADLYVCVTHVNSQTDNTLSGTTVVYDSAEDTSDKALNGKSLAQILQQKITEGAQTKDNGVISMGISPYRYTSIPSAMAQIGYISCDEDFFQLIKDDFQYNVAVAIKDAIVEALELQDN